LERKYSFFVFVLIRENINLILGVRIDILEIFYILGCAWQWKRTVCPAVETEISEKLDE